MGADEYSALAIQAAGAIASNVVSGRNASKENKKAREWNEKMYYKQLEDNRENWRMANEYNLPSAALVRLTDAGLNPLLYYGEGGAMPMVSAAQGAHSGNNPANFAHAKNPFENFTQNMAQMKMLDEQVALMRSERNLIDKQASQTESQTKGQEIQNYIDDKTKDLQIAMRHNNNDLILANIREIDQNIFNNAELTTQQVLTMMQAREYEIKRFDLTREQVVANIEQGWDMVENGRIQADAAWQNACAAWKNAVTAANLSKAQIYNLYQAGRELALQGDFLEKTMDERVRSVRLGNTNLGMQSFNGYMDLLLKRAQIPYWQAQTVKTTMEGNYLRGRNVREAGQTMLNGLNFNFNMAVKALTLMPQNQ